MKKKYIVISVAVVLTISYLFVFTGTKELPPSKVIENYDPYFNMLHMPLTKYKKGFFSHTFFSQATIGNEKYDLRFKIDYLNNTVTFENIEKLNERIKLINKKIAKPFLDKEYSYLMVNSESYFDDIENKTVNLRLIGRNDKYYQLIITISDQDLKLTL